MYTKLLPASKALALLKKDVEKREEILVDLFVKLGPDELRDHVLGVGAEWSEIFDYLVFKKSVLKRCVYMYKDFFHDLVAKNGPGALRDIFGIQANKYDSLYEELFDFVAVADGALYEYVDGAKLEFMALLKNGRGDELRKSLGLVADKYSSLWQEIVDLLIDSVCDLYVTERGLDQFERVLGFFVDGF